MSDMIYIEGVTPEQKEMLDIMWSLESTDDYLDWYETLDTHDQQEADLLKMLLLYELSDQITNVDQAKEIINLVK
jgi:predicted aconitase